MPLLPHGLMSSVAALVSRIPVVFRHVLDSAWLILPADCLSIQTEYIPPSGVTDRKRLGQRQTFCLYGKEITYVQIYRGCQSINAQEVEHRPHLQSISYIRNTHTCTRNLRIYDLIGSWTMAAQPLLLRQTSISRKRNVLNWGFVPGNPFCSVKNQFVTNINENKHST
jgi:hypothetical protein